MNTQTIRGEVPRDVKILTLQELLYINLDGWQLVRMFEVSEVNDDGRYVRSEGFFGERMYEDLYMKDRSHLQLKEVVMLTDWTNGIVLKESFPVYIDSAAEERFRHEAYRSIEPAIASILRITTTGKGVEAFTKGML